MEEKLVMVGDGGRWPSCYWRVDVVRAREKISKSERNEPQLMFELVEYDARRCQAARLESCLCKDVED
jgi:hypothetical protein